MRPRSFLLSILFAVLAGLALPGLAAYPEKPIRLIVPSAPGGAPDVLMRALAQQMSVQMGVPFVIDNKPGGSYVIGTMDVVKAPPDGYTLAYGNIVSLATNRGLLPNVPYDVDKDLTLIGNSFKLVNMMIVNNNLPVKTVGELIAYARKNPGKIAYGSGGNGTTDHLGVELFKSMTGTFMLHVPYKATVGGAHGPAGRQHPADDVEHADRRPGGAGRARARAGGVGVDALAVLPGRSDTGRVRREGLRGDPLGRPDGPGQHAQGRRGTPEQGNARGAREPRGEGALQGAGRGPGPELAGGIPRTVAPRNRQVGAGDQVLERKARLRQPRAQNSADKRS